jgi:hypothetical protein
MNCHDTSSSLLLNKLILSHSESLRMDLVTVVSTKLPWPLPSFTYWYILYKLGWEQAYGVMGLRINKILNVLKGYCLPQS